ncbi:MAG TPA: hypothetical protein PKD51_15965 [Saprospiraceae bacterium]|nr:hypothetical protein [Saprospiraceae bacterium]HMU03165.1 hypothetical protein [Saprospiraceae bacterium]
MREEDHINESPNMLDGAKVIKWAWSGDKPFGLITPNDNGSDSITIYGLAICQYDDSSDVYRFSCNKDWEVQQDEVYKSVEDAIRQIPDQYKFVVAQWQTKEEEESRTNNKMF